MNLKTQVRPKYQPSPEAKNRAKRAGGKASAKNRRGLKQWVVRSALGDRSEPR